MHCLGAGLAKEERAGRSLGGAAQRSYLFLAALVLGFAAELKCVMAVGWQLLPCLVCCEGPCLRSTGKLFVTLSFLCGFRVIAVRGMPDCLLPGRLSPGADVWTCQVPSSKQYLKFILKQYSQGSTRDAHCK